MSQLEELLYHNAVLKCGQRELDLVKRYATHDYDSVLGMYYAKARFYDAEDRRFTAFDPILDGSIYNLTDYVKNPVQFVHYLYVLNNPIIYIDPLGLLYIGEVHNQVVKDIVKNNPGFEKEQFIFYGDHGGFKRENFGRADVVYEFSIKDVGSIILITGMSIVNDIMATQEGENNNTY